MNLYIAYPEILEIIKKEVGVNLNVGFTTINEKTVFVRYEQKVNLLFVEKTVPVTLKVAIDKFEDDNLYLTYDGGIGMDMIAKGIQKVASKFMDLKYFDLLPNSKVVIHLSKIDKLHDALKMIDVKTIGFDASGAKVLFNLK